MLFSGITASPVGPVLPTRPNLGTLMNSTSLLPMLPAVLFPIPIIQFENKPGFLRDHLALGKEHMK